MNVESGSLSSDSSQTLELSAQGSMSDSDSDSDSGDSDKEIVVRHVGAREPAGNHALRIAEPKIPPEHIPAAAKSSPPTQQTMSDQKDGENRILTPAGIEETSVKAPRLARSTSEDSTNSDISVREEDVHILMRSIPEYGQYNEKDAKRNDSYLRSALQHMPQDLLDYTDEFGNTLLLIASQYSCADLVQILLQRGADPHRINSSGASCLHFACYKDSLSMPIVELLLEQGVSVNVAETLYGCTPLHYAASTGELALCQLLIQHGAYIHAHDFDNCSSIDYAIDAGMMEVAEYLRATQNAAHIGNTTHNMADQPTNVGTPSKWDQALSPNGSVMHSLHDSNAKKSAESSTPLAPNSTVFRMILNTNNSSLDEFDQPTQYVSPFSPNPTQNNINSSVEGPGSASSYRAGYTKPPLPTPTYVTQHNGHSSANGSVNNSAKSSPSTERHSEAKSTHSSPGAADIPTPGNNKRGSYQPISPSPYTAVPFSPTKNTTNTNIYVGTSSGYGSGSDSSVGSAKRNSYGNRSSNGAPPALPSPSHMDLLQDTSYSNIDNIKDLSPEKFELYIEQAKSNAKLAKERELYRSVLAQKDQKINSMQSEITTLKRTVGSCKEEIHALTAKLDLLQLPFIEATNTLQDELQTLKRENLLLKEQLSRNK